MTYLLKNILTLFLASTLLAACSKSDSHDKHGDAHGYAEHTEEEIKKGTNRGRILENGDFAIEVTIFEQGMPPHYRLYAYENGKPVDPQKVTASVILTRLDGEENKFSFKPEDGYLSGDGIVTEPHSFDVTVKASYNGKSHSWTYDNYEGRTTISAAMANEVGIEVEPIGPQTLKRTLNVLGRVEFAPNAQSTLRARYPGKILSVMKSEGQRVKAGEVLARIESNDSLQAYDVTSPMDGVIVTRMAHAGDVVFDTPLFVVGDLRNLRVDFHIYPVDMGTVKSGQVVHISSIDGRLKGDTVLEGFLPTTESATQTMIIHAPLDNPSETWMPGMTIKGSVTVEQREVALAVRPEALQRFRDFMVVFAQVGETYEVRMLELGLQTPEWVEVLSGINPGQAYVTGNSFLIKADVEKSGASHDH